ncbi:hypothetical protein DFR79_13213 [Halanaerobium saccharolyticum]|uniref:Phage-related minor tail protein n=1 Tax=Halanaerobium saccharolyticum TaxID=43595 RepID=A0A4R6LE32_9FIRM|nr:hypothetical protein [Halanaerobium saccharolyticum]TDO77681.1 hypothetical protein DFR79_13213 [Halanaerobium saccharolyticum]
MAQKKGITVEIGASTKGLDKALKDIRSQSRKIGRELYQVNRALKFNPDSVELWAQKQDILTERVEQTKEKLDVLKQAEKDMQKQYKSGDVGEKEYREYRRELIKTEDQLESFTDELEKTQRKANEFSRKMQKAADGMEKFGNRMKGIGDNLNTHVTLPITAAFFALTEGTRDFRKEVSTLENNARTANVSIDEMHGYMSDLNAVTGELDSNVEGLSSLLAAGFRDEQLSSVIDDIAGAVIQFPDTLKFENLSESIQETIGSGQSVGQFDEMLSRLGINLDDFNEGLQTAKENGKATDYVMQTLANTGLSDVYEQYKDNNEALVESAEANYDLEQSLAELGAELEPIMTQIKENVIDVVDAFNDLSEEEQDMVIFGAGVAAALGPVLSITGNLSLTLSSLTNVINGAGGLTAALNPYMIGGAVIVGFGLLAKRIYEGNKQLKFMERNVKSLNEAELKRRKDLLESDIQKEERRLEARRNGASEDSIIGEKYSISESQNRLNNLKKDLDETEKALQEIEETNNELEEVDLSGGGGGGSTSDQSDYKNYIDELRAEIESYNFEQEVENMSNDSEKAWAKLENKMYGEFERIDNLKDATAEQKEKLKEMVEQFYNNQYKDYLEEVNEQEEEEAERRKEAAIEREEQLQNELELLKKDGKERELAQLEQQYEAEKELMQEKGQDTATLTKIYREKRLDIIEKYNKKELQLEREKMENRFEMGKISETQYRKYLRERLKQYEKDTDEWRRIREKINETLKAESDPNDFSTNLANLGRMGRNAATGYTGESDSKEGAKSINWMTDAFVDLGLEIEEANQKFVDWKDDLITGLSDAIARGEDLGDVFDNIADQIASMVLQKAVVGPIVNYALGGLNLPTFHEGGFVSPANAIAKMQRYHEGGGIGLKSNEVPAILENGEYVLNKDQVKGLQNGGGSAPINIFDITAIDTQSFAEYVSRNPDAIINVVGRDIMRNGTLRQAIKKS